MNKIYDNKAILRLCDGYAHHQTGTAETTIFNIWRKARIYLFYMALRWPEYFDKAFWPFVMAYVV